MFYTNGQYISISLSLYIYIYTLYVLHINTPIVMISIMIVITVVLFRKCGLTVFSPKCMTKQKQGKGVQQGSGIANKVADQIPWTLKFPSEGPQRCGACIYIYIYTQYIYI